jgi:hypothetical protein
MERWEALASWLLPVGPCSNWPGSSRWKITKEAYASNAASGKQTRSVHPYTARWTTLDVRVFEFDDGSIGYAISGNRKFLPPAPAAEHSWWRPGKREG